MFSGSNGVICRIFSGRWVSQDNRLGKADERHWQEERRATLEPESHWLCVYMEHRHDVAQEEWSSADLRAAAEEHVM